VAVTFVKQGWLLDFDFTERAEAVKFSYLPHNTAAGLSNTSPFFCTSARPPCLQQVLTHRPQLVHGTPPCLIGPVDVAQGGFWHVEQPQHSCPDFRVALQSLCHVLRIRPVRFDDLAHFQPN